MWSRGGCGDQYASLSKASGHYQPTGCEREGVPQMLKSKKTLTRKSYLKRSETPMKKRGETKRKKEERYDEYIKSPVWKKKKKEALKRAGHQCEWTEESSLATMDYSFYPWNEDVRCPETIGLQVHHKTNVRFGGDELPEDLQVFCEPHHDFVERRDFPHRHTTPKRRAH
jgi:hypothetical protein